MLSRRPGVSTARSTASSPAAASPPPPHRLDRARRSVSVGSTDSAVRRARPRRRPIARRLGRRRPRPRQLDAGGLELASRCARLGGQIGQLDLGRPRASARPSAAASPAGASVDQRRRPASILGLGRRSGASAISETAAPFVVRSLHSLSSFLQRRGLRRPSGAGSTSVASAASSSSSRCGARVRAVGDAPRPLSPRSVFAARRAASSREDVTCTTRRAASRSAPATCADEQRLRLVVRLQHAHDLQLGQLEDRQQRHHHLVAQLAPRAASGRSSSSKRKAPPPPPGGRRAG